MRDFRTVFKNRHTVLPVIHVQSRAQVLRNVEIAMNCGADGVFLINHTGVCVDELIEYYHAARERYPDCWIGLNMLRIRNEEALMHIPENECALWTDNAGVTEGSEALAAEFSLVARKRNWRGIYFGGVAFKHQNPIRNKPDAARRAIPYTDVVTTSGEGTGFAPEIRDICAMKAAIGDHPLAIASGISPENVHQFFDADCYLVATNINASFYEIDPQRLRRLMARVDRSSFEPRHRIAS